MKIIFWALFLVLFATNSFADGRKTENIYSSETLKIIDMCNNKYIDKSFYIDDITMKNLLQKVNLCIKEELIKQVQIILKKKPEEAIQYINGIEKYTVGFYELIFTENKYIEAPGTMDLLLPSSSWQKTLIQLLENVIAQKPQEEY